MAGNSIRGAASYCNVSRSTLARKIKGKENVIKSPGPSAVLSINDEFKLVEFLKKCSARGTPLTIKQIQQSVKKIMTSSIYAERKNYFKDDTPSRQWVKKFVQRYQTSIRMRKSEILPKSSAAIRGEDLVKWWVQMDTTLKNEGLIEILNDPTRIYNADETPLEYNPVLEKVIVDAGGQSYVSNKSGNKDSCSVLYTVSHLLFLLFSICFCF